MTKAGIDLVRASHLGKRFGDVVALEDATAAFRAGEIHAVCGENGAGKSTFLKIVAGLIAPDGGEVVAFGKRLPPVPREAIQRGIGMVHQHFSLVPVFTVLENLVLGAEPVERLGVVDFDAARARAKGIVSELGIELPLDAVTEDLEVGERQRIEVVRCLFRAAKLLILDEPTAVLTKSEATKLYAMLRRLTETCGVVVVTHKMDEVRVHADVVTVMRKGRVVDTRPIDRSADLDGQIDAITRAMMAAEPTEARTERDAPAVGAKVLELTDVHRGQELRGLSLSVGASEIVGIAGVEGNGQRAIVELLAGDITPDRGTVRSAKASVLRPDRQIEGLVLDASLRDNLLLGELGAMPQRFGVLDRRALDAEASKRLPRGFGQADLDRHARTLSGGNQQKIVVARALARVVDQGLLVAANPTRGIDMSASRDVHDGLRAASTRGAGVLVLSSDLDELRALCTRILVLYRGKIVAELPPTASDEEFGRHMLGAA